MEKVAERKKLTLKFNLPAGLKKIQHGLEELHAFAQYYNLTEEALLPQSEVNLIQRLDIYAKTALAPLGEAEVPAVAEGAKEPETTQEQWLYNIEQVILFLKEARGRPVNLGLLQEIHAHLTIKLPHHSQGGRLRNENRNLFSFIEEGVLLPGHDELKIYLSELCSFSNDKHVPPFVRAALFFYTITAVRPFHQENEIVAILGAHHILEREKMDLLGLLNLEKHIFFNPKYLLQTSILFGEQNYLERLDADLTPYLEICTEHYLENMAEAKQILISCVRDDFEYEKLTPRLKNNLNFWLEKAFFIHRHKLKNLTPRQHDILTLLGKYGQLATKDLVPIFKVDRKTIQRDFNILLELGLVEQRGGGRNLKYFLDFKISL